MSCTAHMPADAADAYRIAQNYITEAAPQEDVFCSAWESHGYYIFDFMPHGFDPEDPIPDPKPVHHKRHRGASEAGHILATMQGYTCVSYGAYGPVLVQKSSGACLMHRLDDPKGVEHYRTLLDHSRRLAQDTLAV